MYEVFDEMLSRHVALKVLTRLDAGALYRFKRAFRLLSEIRHPNLTELYELGSHEGLWYYTLELVRGPRLSEFVHPPVGGWDAVESVATADLAEGNTISPTSDPPSDPMFSAAAEEAYSRTRTAMAGLARGLVALHDHGVIHRDIKPANVLVDPDFRVKLLDFGLASCLADDDPMVTSNGAAIGTPAYMAPELGSGARLTPATDWYSVGVLLYQLLTGTLPFGRSGRFWTMRPEDPTLDPPSARAPNVPQDLEALCLGLLRQEPERRLSGHEVLERLGAPVPVPPRTKRDPTDAKDELIGRQQELEVLEGCLSEVRSGTAVTVAIHGRSGIGKSAVARAFTSRRHVGDALVLRGTCRAQGSVPFNAFDALIDELAALLLRLPSLLRGTIMPNDPAALVRLFPVLSRAEIFGSEEYPAATVPGRLRRRGFAALKELLARLSARRTVVMVIDDVHQMDEDSRSLLMELLTPPGVPSLLLLAVGQQPLELGRPASELFGQVRSLEIGPLPEREARILALRACGGVCEGAPACGILAQANGSPLLIELLARHARSTCDDGVPRGESLAPTVSGLVASLPDGARAGIEVLAVADDVTPPSLVCQASGLDPDSWSQALALLREMDLVRVSGGGAAECRHDRIRNAVSDALDAHRRRDLHRSLAESLQQQSRVDRLAVIRHLRAAGDTARAAEWAVAAAADAEESLAFATAADLLRFASKAGGGGAAEGTLQRRLAYALRSAGRAEEAAQAFLAAIGSFGPVEAHGLRLCAATVLASSGRYQAAAPLFEPLLTEAGHTAPEGGLRLLAALALERKRLSWRGLECTYRRADEVEPALLRTIDLLLEVGHSLIWDDTLKGFYYHTKTLRLALDAGEPERICRAMSYEVALEGLQGNPQSHRRSEDLVRRARLAADVAGTDNARCTIALTEGLNAYAQGRWRAARNELRRHQKLQRALDPGAARELSASQFHEFECMFQLGRVPELATQIHQVRLEARERGDHNLPALLLTLSIYARLATGDAEAAERDIQSSVDQTRPHASAWGAAAVTAQAIVSRTLVALYRGQGAVAWELAQELWPVVRRIHLLHVPFWRVTMNHVRARAALAAALEGRSPARLLRLVCTTAHALRKESLAWARPIADSMEAAALSAGGRDQQAHLLHRAAASEFGALDMELFAAVERLRQGQTQRGDEGRELAEQAATWMSDHGIADPLRMASTLGHWRT